MLAQLTKQKMRPPISPWTLSPKAPSDQCGALFLFHQSGASQIGISVFSELLCLGTCRNTNYPLEISQNYLLAPIVALE